MPCSSHACFMQSMAFMANTLLEAICTVGCSSTAVHALAKACMSCACHLLCG
jgi:hypothetical protein